MRYLLKRSSSVVGNRSQVAIKQILGSSPSQPRAGLPAAEQADGGGKAWGQRCSPDCGCILRIEAELLSDATRASSITSPTIIRASYHAKRVVTTTTTTVRKTDHDDDTTVRLKPLVSTRREPILASCECPTLHRLARQTVEYLPGKTVARVANEIDSAAGGSRSSVALRHTVLRECLASSANDEKKRRLPPLFDDAHTLNPEGGDGGDGVREMESTERLGGRCFDLVEDSLLSIIHARAPRPRKDGDVESYSPTLGGHFRMYSRSGRNRPIVEVDDDDDDLRRDENADAGDWRRGQSPSSFFLFGDDDDASDYGRRRIASDDNSLSGHVSGSFVQDLKDLICDALLGSDDDGPKRRRGLSSAARGVSDDGARNRPATAYLRLLDMYGDGSEEEEKEKEEVAMDDWLVHVDQIHSRAGRSTAG